MRTGELSKEQVKRTPRNESVFLTTAQRSNFSPLTALGYHAWRARSLGLLSGTTLPLEREARLFLAHAKPRPGERWLDVGTSTGFYAGVLASAECDVLAIDISPAMLRAASARVRNDAIEWGLLNVEDSGLPSESFDGITVGATLGETARPLLALAEMERLLKPGGRLWTMYVARTGGEVQTLLSHFGGATFPDRAQVAAALPACSLQTALEFGPVVFELYGKRT
ncbi:class I SAM-dependent methyltransferase [Deinococcus yavapaiensis]|uniref:2-polyprenyl-6-hydroxyphenyl methylase/3-demethylubiquinone-9 3-methyltransferase n=1 Tax=Deinococcus yavapaiensis KR-236 TaxID=694435 RepID=A0A318S8R2_9DEIO|nr:class I SAM-dependent methyltransferase [Deinococcus yavapaiensis]PYE54505.1 2-polyprenyl-6-hydroxyphenyl methylase/3-demethylubiquinone-9 3-methyltransferase [Deinococcus yavapaiensis KR-236]